MPRSTDNASTARLVMDVQGLSKRYARDLRRSQRTGISAIRAELLARQADSVELRDSEFWAIRDVTFEVRSGEALGIVGRNGGGKSTLLRVLAGISKPTSGQVKVHGTVGALLDPSAGFNLLLTGRENVEVIYTLFAQHRPGRDTIEAIATYAGLSSVLNYPVRTYSQGMRLRLGFSVMVHVDPDVMLIDEALAVGDTAFQLQCIEQLHKFRASGGALVFVSHSLWLFQHLASHGIHLSKGVVELIGSPADVADHYLVELQQASKFDAGEGSDIFERETFGRSDAEEVQADRAAEIDSNKSLVPDPDDEPEIAVHDGGDNPMLQRPVQFGPVTVTGPDGGPVRSGGSMVMTFQLRTSKAVPVAELAFAIWTADLALSVACDLSSAEPWGPLKGYFPLPLGDSFLRYEVDQFPLMPGRYAIRGAVFEADTSDVVGLHGYEDTPSWFEVEAADDISSEGAGSAYSGAGQLAPLRSIDAQWSSSS